MNKDQETTSWVNGVYANVLYVLCYDGRCATRILVPLRQVRAFLRYNSPRSWRDGDGRHEVVHIYESTGSPPLYVHIGEAGVQSSKA
jgi:hypothetical protein